MASKKVLSSLCVHIQCKKIIAAAHGDEAQQLIERMTDMEEKAAAQHDYIAKLQDKLKALQTNFDKCVLNQYHCPDRIPMPGPTAVPMQQQAA